MYQHILPLRMRSDNALKLLKPSRPPRIRPPRWRAPAPPAVADGAAASAVPGVPPGSHVRCEGSTSIAPPSDDSAHITEARIGVDGDFPARLAVGATTGRGTTTPSRPGSCPTACRGTSRQCQRGDEIGASARLAGDGGDGGADDQPAA